MEISKELSEFINSDDGRKISNKITGKVSVIPNKFKPNKDKPHNKKIISYSRLEKYKEKYTFK